jgi:homoserine kinase
MTRVLRRSRRKSDCRQPTFTEIGAAGKWRSDSRLSTVIAAVGGSTSARRVIPAREGGSAVVATQDRPTALTDALYTFRPRHLPAAIHLDALYAEVRRRMLGSQSRNLSSPNTAINGVVFTVFPHLVV